MLDSESDGEQSRNPLPSLASESRMKSMINDVQLTLSDQTHGHGPAAALLLIDEMNPAVAQLCPHVLSVPGATITALPLSGLDTRQVCVRRQRESDTRTQKGRVAACAAAEPQNAERAELASSLRSRQASSDGTQARGRRSGGRRGSPRIQEEALARGARNGGGKLRRGRPCMRARAPAPPTLGVTHAFERLPEAAACPRRCGAGRRVISTPRHSARAAPRGRERARSRAVVRTRGRGCQRPRARAGNASARALAGCAHRASSGMLRAAEA